MILLKAAFIILASLHLQAYAGNPLLEGKSVKCSHDHLKHDIKSLDVDEERPNDNGRLLSLSFAQMIIYPYHNHLSTAPASYKQYIQNELAPAVISYFQGALRVKFPIRN